MNDRETIDRFRTKERLNSDNGTIKRIAECEAAGFAVLDAVTQRKQELQTAGNLTDDGIKNEIAPMVNAWQAQKQQMIDTIIGPLQAINQPSTESGLPARTDEMREISDSFNRLTGDKRMAHLVAAIQGRDQKLAEALATEPATSSTLIDIDREAVRKRVQSADTQQTNADAAEIAKTAQAARHTLDEISHKLSGASS